MAQIRARFIEKVPRTPTVASFRFRPGEKMEFLPGQFLQVIFDEAARDNKELNKYLSFSCAPGKDYFEVTKRLSQSAFSQRLSALKPADEVLFKGPMGTCVVKPQDTRIGFLIGGIGITPAISIIEDLTGRKAQTDICLVYANRVEEEIAFKKELDAWQRQNPNLHLSYVVTECQPKDNTCIFGTINNDLIRARVCDFLERVFFIFGPPKMVGSMKQLLLDIGCREENIKTENFIGY